MLEPSLFYFYLVWDGIMSLADKWLWQGEDVVAGIRTPEDLDTMKSCMPEAYKELVENCEILERHYKDMMVILLISKNKIAS